MNIKVIRPKYIRRFHESVITQHMLLVVNYELIYLYELSYLSRNNIFYGWVKKGVSSFAGEILNVSFEITLSYRHFYNVLGWKEAFIYQSVWI